MHSAVLVHNLHEINRHLSHVCAYFGFVEELSEAASWILLGMWGQLQDELHDNGLVRHLFHQSFLLQDRKSKHEGISNAPVQFDFTWPGRQCKSQTEGRCVSKINLAGLI